MASDSYTEEKADPVEWGDDAEVEDGPDLGDLDGEDLDEDAIDEDGDLEEGDDDLGDDDLDEDDDADADEDGEGDEEALDELEAEELEMLTDDEESEALIVDEAAEMRAIRRAELAMDSESGGERSEEEFLCRSCFLVLKRSQLADATRMWCRDCAA